MLRAKMLLPLSAMMLAVPPMPLVPETQLQDYLRALAQAQGDEQSRIQHSTSR